MARGETGAPEAPHVGEPVVARLHEAERAVRGCAGERIGQPVADVTDDVGQHVGSPDLTRIAQHRLVEAGHVARTHHAAAAGHAHGLHRGVVEREQRLRGDLGDRQGAHAERRLQLVGRRHTTGQDERRGSPRQLAEDAGEPRRPGDALGDDVTKVAARDLLDDLREHPVRRRGVVLVAGARLPVEPPAAEGGAPPRARGAGERRQRRSGEPGGVQHHLLHRDDVLAVRAESRNVLGDGQRGVDDAVADQRPQRGGDERLRGREEDIAGVGAGVADRERDDTTVTLDANWHDGRRPAVDLGPSAA